MSCFRKSIMFTAESTCVSKANRATRHGLLYRVKITLRTTIYAIYVRKFTEKSRFTRGLKPEYTDVHHMCTPDGLLRPSLSFFRPFDRISHLSLLDSVMALHSISPSSLCSICISYVSFSHCLKKDTCHYDKYVGYTNTRSETDSCTDLVVN